MKTLLMLMTCLLSACATQSNIKTHTQQEQDAYHSAIVAEVNCGKQYIAQTDDGISDAGTVALALSVRCGTEYAAATDAAAIALMDNDAQQFGFKQKRYTTTERIQNFLPYVMQYRQAHKKPL